MNDSSAPALPVPPVAAQAAAAVAGHTRIAAHDVAIILGSGWRPPADVIGAAEFEIPLADLPGFPPPAVEGHGGTVRSLDVAGSRVLMFLGRTHYYESRDNDSALHNL